MVKGAEVGFLCVLLLSVWRLSGSLRTAHWDHGCVWGSMCIAIGVLFSLFNIKGVTQMWC